MVICTVLYVYTGGGGGLVSEEGGGGKFYNSRYMYIHLNTTALKTEGSL